ncbi:hypothetical protein RESH_02607 [Rhodopirellula europaea SH398]|uniref:Uncharacterized protein n=1 Tax=Rhodopirellula europaea SH398 TaxID=1263868 RepID=M5SKG7_9BACT|nr:hypothetical protein RESH_02607 [Rhodopirellula europaea SH398]
MGFPRLAFASTTGRFLALDVRCVAVFVTFRRFWATVPLPSFDRPWYDLRA